MVVGGCEASTKQSKPRKSHDEGPRGYSSSSIVVPNVYTVHNAASASLRGSPRTATSFGDEVYLGDDCGKRQELDVDEESI